MIPQPPDFRNDESGIRRVVEAYFKYLPQYDIELMPHNAKRYDLKAVHAGMTDGDCDIAHLHGLYWTADYPATAWEYRSNAQIVDAIRHAREVTVPSAWVTETFQRDMRFTPYVIPHGIEWDEWQHNEPNEGFVLWNKNRNFDVCSPKAMGELAHTFSDIQFVSTFGVDRNPSNLAVTGKVTHAEMKKYVQRSAVYLSTAKETFGLGTLEAMASGKPVLGFAHGGNLDLVKHGVNGYLAQPGNLDDLAEGLVYCLKHQDTLGANGREMAKRWTWDKAVEMVAGVYERALESEPATVSVVIPVYNKTFEQVKRAIDSVVNQTLKPTIIWVADDNSPDEECYRQILKYVVGLQGDGVKIGEWSNNTNMGVANLRNELVRTSIVNSNIPIKYICCLDADDWLEPDFLKVCVGALEADSSLGLAYTGLRFHQQNGESAVSRWPGEWNFDRQCDYYKRLNQVPTCNVFRRAIWERLGGYRQRYAPDGAGSEDAEFWTRIGAYGWKCEQVTEAALFNYSEGGQVSSNPDYQEVDWLAWHPWSRDKEHPFASYATPEDGKLSHPVRQYDEPVVSVIIPVGPGHEKEVINALDSLEAQTFRKWEVVVVWDLVKYSHTELLHTRRMYPYAKWIFTRDSKGNGNFGAGYARNRGVELARAPLILFLDADDTLHPEALQKMLDTWSTHQMAVYTDYVRQAFIDEQLAKEMQDTGRLQSFNPQTGEAIILNKAFEYDCERAQQQPNQNDLYIWNLITTLIPKSWHDEIGGFDEEMETWEDWDYWIRMAKAGKCFYRLPEQLVRYRTYTGSRRERAVPDTDEGRQKALAMIKYMRAKETEIQMCRNCGRQTSRSPRMSTTRIPAQQPSSDDFAKCRYTGKKGNHHVIGQAVFGQEFPGRNMMRRDNGFKVKYGYISRGHVCDVHVDDIRLMVGKWEKLPDVAVPEMPAREIIEPEPIVKDMEPPPLPDLEAPFSLQSLPGVTPVLAKRLTEAGLDSKETILEAGLEGLGEIKGLSATGIKAKLILKAVQE